MYQVRRWRENEEGTGTKCVVAWWHMRQLVSLVFLLPLVIFRFGLHLGLPFMAAIGTWLCWPEDPLWTLLGSAVTLHVSIRLCRMLTIANKDDDDKMALNTRIKYTQVHELYVAECMAILIAGIYYEWGQDIVKALL